MLGIDTKYEVRRGRTNIQEASQLEGLFSVLCPALRPPPSPHHIQQPPPTTPTSPLLLSTIDYDHGLKPGE
eukprot:scaffold347598_cov70-Cyclotella_meneghiniana.AAC.2